MAKKELYQGVAVGGPIDGRTLISRARHARGVVLVDKPGNRAAIYQWDADDGEFIHVRNEGEDDAEGWRSLDHDKRLVAGMGTDWEVLAYDDRS